MGTPSLFKLMYRKFTPRRIRNSPLTDWVKCKLLGHDAIYNVEYYEAIVEGPAARSAKSIAASILADFRPSTVVDVGCGTGALLKAMQDGGCKVFGLEYSEAAIKYCRA